MRQMFRGGGKFKIKKTSRKVLNLKDFITFANVSVYVVSTFLLFFSTEKAGMTLIFNNEYGIYVVL